MAKKNTEETIITVARKPVPYEMVAIFKPFLPDKIRNEADAKVEQIISDAGGSVSLRDIWGKRYLAYEVQKHTEGYYVMYQFEAPSRAMEDIKKLMNRHQEVLRYLVIRKDAKEGTATKIKVKKTITKEESDSKKAEEA
ncbi:MAG: 30S ribosomal protein S6 [Candidatus Dojkabacteria bacterium]|nr:MAG: 30S ribosomal protein S6 [Candidatus Dojkabacteria bacterium]